MRDVWALARKEITLFLRVDDTRVSGSARLVLLFLFSAMLARQLGGAFIVPWIATTLSGALACLAVLPVVVDSFAGERERRTLETLLTTPASDAAILGGKLLALVLYGALISIAVLLSGIVVGAIRAGLTGSSYPISAAVAGAAIVYAIVTSLLTALIGLHVSLRAASVRHALQTLGLLMCAITVGPLLLGRLIPESSKAVIPFVTAANPTQLVARTLVSMIVVSAVLFAVALLRFRRSQLVLN
jgi:ABC-2 type transport system permease protein